MGVSLCQQHLDCILTLGALVLLHALPHVIEVESNWVMADKFRQCWIYSPSAEEKRLVHLGVSVETVFLS